MGYRKKTCILFTSLFILIALFILIGLNSRNWQYALSRRIPEVIGIVLTGSSIAFSSMIFQTITNNRILTPSVLGLDFLYIFIQTLIVFIFGSSTLIRTNEKLNFLLAVGSMALFSVILFRILFKREGSNIFFLLLFGMVFGTFFQSLSSFMQMIIDPNEFMVIQNRMFASFNNINTDILWLALFIMVATMGYTYRFLAKLDTLSLGRENAINLGVEYDEVVRSLLIIVSILVSVSTALVGPITFLGLLVVNITRGFLNTYKHSYLLSGSMLISSITLVGGQLIAGRIINFATPISVIINFIGGIYLIYILLREAKA
ncbi:MAG TPA: iron chelate uptake ABC transporter family permease subunit [Tepidimicrobium sp.]|nr:iron chelate uptake ABC transporter family permease subunit [Tepidimicrobium sp.]